MLFTTALTAFQPPSTVVIGCRPPARTSPVALQLDGGGFLKDLAKGFSAGFNTPQEEIAAEVEEQKEETQVAPASPSPVDPALAARRAAWLAAKREQRAKASPPPPSPKPPPPPPMPATLELAAPPPATLELATPETKDPEPVADGRTTLSAEEGAAFLASIPQVKMLTPEEEKAFLERSKRGTEEEAAAGTVEEAAAGTGGNAATVQPATLGWANSDVSPDEAKAAELARIRALKEEAVFGAAEAGARILSAEEEKELFAQGAKKQAEAVAAAAAAAAEVAAAAAAAGAAAAAASSGSMPSAEDLDEEAIFAQAVAQAQQAQAARAAASTQPGFDMATAPTADLRDLASRPVQTYADTIRSMVEPSSSAVPETVPETVPERAAREAQEAKERGMANTMRDGPKAWWQQALEAGGKIAAASAEAVSEANAKKEAEGSAKGVDPITAALRAGSRKKLYKQLNEALERDDYDGAAKIKEQLDQLSS